MVRTVVSWAIPNLTIGSFLARLLAAVVVAMVHSFVAAILARRLGDAGPMRDGRARLAAWGHLDPFGTLHAMLFLVAWSAPLRLDAAALRGGARVGVVVGAGAALIGLASLALGARSLASLIGRDAGANALDMILVAVADVALATAVAQLVPLPPFLGGAFWRFARRASGRPKALAYGVGAAVLFALSLAGVTGMVMQPWRTAAFRWLGF